MKLILILLMSFSSYASAEKDSEKCPVELQQIEDSLVVIGDIINSDEFKERVLAEKRARDDIALLLE